MTFTFDEELVLMSGSKTITVYELAQSGLVVSELKKTCKPRSRKGSLLVTGVLLGGEVGINFPRLELLTHHKI